MKDHITAQEGMDGWERFWRNTQVLRFVIGPNGEKQAVRSSEPRRLPKHDYFDFRKRKKRKK